VVDLIIIQQKRKENIQKNLKLENIVNGVISILFIKNLNFNWAFALSLKSMILGFNERA